MKRKWCYLNPIIKNTFTTEPGTKWISFNGLFIIIIINVTLGFLIVFYQNGLELGFGSYTYSLCAVLLF